LSQQSHIVIIIWEQYTLVPLKLQDESPYYRWLLSY